MKIGISTASLFLKYSTIDGVRLLKESGINDVEVFLSTYSEYESEFAQSLARIDNINIHSVHALSLQYEPMLFSAHPLVRSDAEHILRKVLSSAQTLGATNYTFHGPAVLKKTASSFNMDKFALRINELCDIASEYGVNICFENTHYGLFTKPEFFVNLHKKASQVKMCYDIKHALMAGCNPYHFLDDIKGVVNTVHLVDVVGNDTALPFNGDVDFTRIIDSIACNNNDAVCMIEAYSKDFSNIEELIGSYKKLKDIIE